MYISEMCGGETARLDVVINGAKMEFRTTVVDVEDKKQAKALAGIAQKFPYALVEPIVRDNKVIGFPPNGVSYAVTYVDKDTQKPYEWQNVIVKQVAFADGSKYHIFISDKDAKEVNRRERYRLWLGCDGLLQIGIGQKATSVIIKDISATGISFIIENPAAVDAALVPKNSTLVSLSFSDVETNTKFRINAVVVRIEEMEDGRVLYGCRMTQESSSVAKFINTKQRERNRLNK